MQSRQAVAFVQRKNIVFQIDPKPPGVIPIENLRNEIDYRLRGYKYCNSANFQNTFKSCKIISQTRLNCSLN